MIWADFGGFDLKRGTKIRGSMEILKLERIQNAVQITGSTKTKGHIGRSV